ncbi:unnamed protein product [Amoebophrya sp. A120]|nr:unnamed protein product [Amoebophrya sp. A120]|eukprot:GSA120T00001776001.1
MLPRRENNAEAAETNAPQPAEGEILKDDVKRGFLSSKTAEPGRSNIPDVGVANTGGQKNAAGTLAEPHSSVGKTRTSAISHSESSKQSAVTYSQTGEKNKRKSTTAKRVSISTATATTKHQGRRSTNRDSIKVFSNHRKSRASIKNVFRASLLDDPEIIRMGDNNRLQVEIGPEQTIFELGAKKRPHTGAGSLAVADPRKSPDFSSSSSSCDSAAMGTFRDTRKRGRRRKATTRLSKELLSPRALLLQGLQHQAAALEMGGGDALASVQQIAASGDAIEGRSRSLVFGSTNNFLRIETALEGQLGDHPPASAAAIAEDVKHEESSPELHQGISRAHRVLQTLQRHRALFCAEDQVEELRARVMGTHFAGDVSSEAITGPVQQDALGDPAHVARIEALLGISEDVFAQRVQVALDAEAGPLSALKTSKHAPVAPMTVSYLTFLKNRKKQQAMKKRANSRVFSNDPRYRRRNDTIALQDSDLNALQQLQNDSPVTPAHPDAAPRDDGTGEEIYGVAAIGGSTAKRKSAAFSAIGVGDLVDGSATALESSFSSERLSVADVGTLVRAFITQPVMIQCQIESLVAAPQQGGLLTGDSSNLENQPISELAAVSKQLTEQDALEALAVAGGAGGTSTQQPVGYRTDVSWSEFVALVGSVRNGEVRLEYPVDLLFQYPRETNPQGRRLRALERLQAALEQIWERRGEHFRVLDLRQALNPARGNSTSGAAARGGPRGTTIVDTIPEECADEGAEEAEGVVVLPSEVETGGRITTTGGPAAQQKSRGRTLRLLRGTTARITSRAVHQPRAPTTLVEAKMSQRFRAGARREDSSVLEEEDDEGGELVEQNDRGRNTLFNLFKQAARTVANVTKVVFPPKQNEQLLILMHVCECLCKNADMLLKNQDRISLLKQDVDNCRPRLKILHRLKTDALEQALYRRQVVRAKLEKRRKERRELQKQLVFERRKTLRMMQANPNRELAEEVQALKERYKIAQKQLAHFERTKATLSDIRKRREEDYEILLSDCNEYSVLLNHHARVTQRNCGLKLLLEEIVQTLVFRRKGVMEMKPEAGVEAECEKSDLHGDLLPMDVNEEKRKIANNLAGSYETMSQKLSQLQDRVNLLEANRERALQKLEQKVRQNEVVRPREMEPLLLKLMDFPRRASIVLQDLEAQKRGSIIGGKRGSVGTGSRRLSAQRIEVAGAHVST